MNWHKQSSFMKYLSYFIQLLQLVWNIHPVYFTTWAIFMLIPGVFPVLQIWLQKVAVDQVAELGNGTVALQQVMMAVGAMYFFNVATVALNQIAAIIYTILREDVGYELKRGIAVKALSLPYTAFEQSGLYDKVQLAQAAVGKNILDALKNVMNAAKIILSLIGIVWVLLNTHWSLPIVLFFSAVPGITLLVMIKKRRFRLTVATTPQARQMEYTFKLMLGRESAKELRIFQLGSFLLLRWQTIFEEVRKLFIKQSIRESFSETFGVLMLSLASGGVAFVLVWQVGLGHLSIGSYISLTTAVVTLQSMLGSFGQNLGEIFEIGFHVRKLYDFLEGHDETEAHQEHGSFALNSSIAVSNLRFSYPGVDRTILNGMTFTIQQGEKVAIVGENGAGKSTLINCLLGLYPVERSTIYFDDTDINDIHPHQLWSHISVVFQDFMKYSFSLRENVGFGQLTHLQQDEWVHTALRQAGAEKLVEMLPEGLESQLGKQFVGGQELSGGQWQRIAIARAFMRAANILVFDEPTAALDPQAELEMFKCFVELARDKTAIMISHRLGPARLADRILVLKGGNLVEQGSHDELMKLNGEYASMFSSQAQWYQEQTKISCEKEAG